MTALLRLSGLLLITAACLLVLLAPAAVAETPTTTPGASAPATPPAETGSTSGSSAPSQAETLTVEPAPTPPPASSEPSAPRSTTTPRVHVQHAQHPSRGAPATPAKTRAGRAPGKGTPSGAARPNGPRAPSPSALTPALPLAFSASLAGIPTFFIESFRIPPFLLPVFQAAGTAYGVPWQVLAAINEVETDYGRDLSTSSAGAEGWMQFLPSSWTIYGVDANGDGFKDPYNPADAIFAAARYLRAAGAASDLRGAIFAYNHSRAYVESVLLRARLLGGTPTELLGALTGLTEARFPVHATSHFADGFPAASGRTLAGTTIYSQPGAPVIAVQDGQISRIGDTHQLGHFVSLRDAYGNTYTYAHLGEIARLYPVLQPHEGSGASPAGTHAREAAEAAPTVPASAGVQPRAQASLAETPTISAPALGGVPGAAGPASPGGAGAGVSSAGRAPAGTSTGSTATTPAKTVSAFRAGPNDVYLHPLRVGVRVIAGTVLGHVGAEAGAGQSASDGAHMLFQIRPAGAGAPLIDPKPILDGWVQLENTSVYRAGGAKVFLAAEPSPGQVLLESKQQLEQQVLANRGIRLDRCGRQDVQTGEVDRRVLAVLEFLAVSSLRPAASGLPCSGPAPGGEGGAPARSTAQAVDITAINGVRVAAHHGAGSITDTTIHKLLTLQGPLRPRQIISLTSFAGAENTLARGDHGGRIGVSFVAPARSVGHLAGAFATGITPTQWIQLIARLGEIPSPVVRSDPSAASIPDHPAPAGANAGASGGNG